MNYWEGKIKDAANSVHMYNTLCHLIIKGNDSGFYTNGRGKWVRFKRLVVKVSTARHWQQLGSQNSFLELQPDSPEKTTHQVVVSNTLVLICNFRQHEKQDLTEWRVTFQCKYLFLKSSVFQEGTESRSINNIKPSVESQIFSKQVF